jgi:hypothetical protein
VDEWSGSGSGSVTIIRFKLGGIDSRSGSEDEGRNFRPYQESNPSHLAQYKTIFQRPSLENETALK